MQAEDLIRRPDGSYVNYHDAEPRHQLAHDLVEENFPRAEDESERLFNLKKHMLGEMTAYREMMLQDYGVKVSGREGGFSVKSLCGTRRIELSVAKHISFGEELLAAKELLDDFLNEELQSSSEAIRAIVSSAFKLNSKGRLDTGGILGLKKHRFNNPIWKRAMDAIEDAICHDSSTTYLRFYRVNPENKTEKIIPLDIAKV
ncbi:DUF3164 family protein [Epibacterium ulvae]|uniref:DUF3164 family protein n=1 Tax=Epibacterium ulvae TaxID=1156985 RepID=UPI00249397C2|nr:DUF3164 family protein [Epibacterium ulvae]